MKRTGAKSAVSIKLIPENEQEKQDKMKKKTITNHLKLASLPEEVPTVSFSSKRTPIILQTPKVACKPHK